VITLTSEAVHVNDVPLPLLTEFQVMAMTVNQLKEELGKRKLSKMELRLCCSSTQ
jgi:hypothetical protein